MNGLEYVYEKDCKVSISGCGSCYFCSELYIREGNV